MKISDFINNVNSKNVVSNTTPKSLSLNGEIIKAMESAGDHDKAAELKQLYSELNDAITEYNDLKSGSF